MKIKELRGLSYVGAGILSLWLATVVFISHALSGFLETKVVNGEPYAWTLIFLWYSAFLFGGLLAFVWMLKAYKKGF